MKKLHPTRLALLLLLLSCAQPASVPPGRALDRSERGIDVLHYDIELEIQPPLPGAIATVTIQFLAEKELTEIELDAVGLEIASVAVRHEASPEWSVDTGQLTVSLDNPMPEGAHGWVRVHYRTNPTAGLYTISPGSSGVDHIPQVYTQGECSYTRYWLPCNDTPADRATHTLTLRVPGGWTTVAAGSRIESRTTRGGARLVETWSLDEEVPPYLFTLVAGPFRVLREEWNGVDLLYVVEPEDVERAQVTFSQTADILSFLSDYTRFPYPFSKYSQACVREFPYGGMENVSATTMTRGLLHDAAWDTEFPSHGTVAHEAAHQWFGDVVTCATWPHVWLNEGFATYFEMLYAEWAHGEDEFLTRIGGSIDAYANACRGADTRAIIEHDYEDPFELFFTGGLYAGGAARLHLLRGWLGDEPFRNGIAAYLQENAWRSVVTDAFQAAMEQASGVELEQFFKEWLESPGYPELEVEWTGQDGSLSVQLRQVHGLDQGAPEAFSFPLDIAWETVTGGWHEQRVWVDEPEEEFQFALDPPGSQVLYIDIDPHAWVPMRFAIRESAASTASRLLGSQSARSRQLAARTLADTAIASVVIGLWSAAEGDNAHAVRIEAINSLSALCEDDSRRALRAWEAELDPRVRTAWIRYFAPLAVSGDQAAAKLLKAVLQDQEESPAARAAALAPLCALAPDRFAVADLCVPLLSEETPWETLRSAAFDSLAKFAPVAETRDILVDHAVKGNPGPLREAALRALRPWLPEDEADGPVRFAIARALESNNVRLRRVAAEVLAIDPSGFERQLEAMAAEEPDLAARRKARAALGSPD